MEEEIIEKLKIFLWGRKIPLDSDVLAKTILPFVINSNKDTINTLVKELRKKRSELIKKEIHHSYNFIDGYSEAIRDINKTKPNQSKPN